MEIKIYSAEQARGYNFSMLPNLKAEIQSAYPLSKPLKHLFIQFDKREAFTDIAQIVEVSAIPFLTGLSQDELMKAAIKVEILDSVSGKLLFEKNYAHVAEKQLVFG